MLIDLEDQINMVKEEALAAGVPNIRYIHASRTLPGPEDVDRIFEAIIEGLTKPLTKKEKEGPVRTISINRYQAGAQEVDKAPLKPQ